MPKLAPLTAADLATAARLLRHDRLEVHNDSLAVRLGTWMENNLPALAAMLNNRAPPACERRCTAEALNGEMCATCITAFEEP